MEAENINIAELQRQLAEKEAELRRVSSELVDVKEELAREVVGNTVYDDAGNPVQQVGVMRDITERKGQEAENRSLMLLLDTIDSECFIKDKDGNYLYINKAYEQQFGVKREDVIGKDDTFVFDPELAVQLQENDRRLMSSKKKEVIEESGLVMGESVTYLTSKAPLFDENGEVFGICGAGIDITEKKKTEDALHESEYRLRVALDASQAGWYDTDLTTGSSVWDERTIRIWGQDPATFTTSVEYALDAIHPEDKAWFHPLFFAALESDTQDLDAEYRILWPDGQVRWKRDQFHIFRDSDGKAIRFIGATVDTTEQYELEQALRESEELYRNLVEQISDALFTLEIDGTVKYISPAIEAILGYAPDEVTGLAAFDFITPDEHDLARSRLNMLGAGEFPRYSEYQALTKSGEKRWIRISSQPIEENGRITGIRGVMTDIHDQKIAEKQLEQAAVLAERERLARDLHDAVTQSLFMATATAEALPRVWQRNPEQARRALEELRLLTRGALAEMRSLLLELRPASFAEQPLGTLLRQLTDGLAARSRILITTTIVGECLLPDDVQMALYRITQEALNNTIKHADASRVLVSLQCEDEQVLLLVNDDGIGYDPEIVVAHFGLENMQARARDIGAEIHFKSSPDNGAEITVTWQPRGNMKPANSVPDQ